MVPFFGQGLNCGLEDVRVLHILLRKHGVSPLVKGLGNFDPALAAALGEYSETRHKDLFAICDMAMQN
jgi:kynurenine 3-monooxygenase